MNCNECQRACLENGGRDLSAGCVEHLVGCATCRKINERAVVISKLLALKKYEHPDPMFEIRNAAAIRKRISEEKPSPFADFVGGLFGIKRWHIALAGAFAVCLTIVAVRMALPPAQNNAATTAVAKSEPAPPAPAPAIEKPQPDPTNATWVKPMYVIKDSGSGPAMAGETKFGVSNNGSRAIEFNQPGPLRPPPRAQE